MQRKNEFITALLYKFESSRQFIATAPAYQRQILNNGISELNLSGNRGTCVLHIIYNVCVVMLRTDIRLNVVGLYYAFEIDYLLHILINSIFLMHT